MKKRIFAFLLAVASAGCILTSCGKTNLDGKYELCMEDGTELGIDVKFKEDGKMTFNGDSCKFEVLNANTIKIKSTDDEGLSDEFTFNIVDDEEKLIYIEGVSEKYMKHNLNEAAKNLYKAVNSAVCDLDEEDIWIEGTGIISSDDSRTVFENGMGINDVENSKKLKEYSKFFFSDIDDYEYIAVMKDGICIAAAVSEKGGKIAGTFPANKVIEIDSGDTAKKYENKDMYSLSDIYKEYNEQLR